jgi:hypothetical protein
MAAKKTAAKKAAKEAEGPAAADSSVADKVAAKAKKDGGQAVYRLDQGESLPGPDSA